MISYVPIGFRVTGCAYAAAATVLAQQIFISQPEFQNKPLTRQAL